MLNGHSAVVEKPYGSWDSPITADLVTQGAKRFSNIAIDGETIYWTELRPEENGRTLIVSEKGDVTPPGYTVRTRINEYGGLAFAVQDGVVYFVNDSDQRIYIQKGGEVRPLSQGQARFGDLLPTPFGLVTVCERNDKQTLIAIDPETGAERQLASGYDFYSSPTVSPDGKQLAWLTWNLPNMPWDGTELWVGEIKEGGVSAVRKVAGGIAESIFQPQWSPNGVLHFISDKTGWWNLYRDNKSAVETVYPLNAEFGLPQWLLGMSTYGFLGDQIVCTYFQEGRWVLGLLKEGSLSPLPFNQVAFNQIRTGKECAVLISTSATEPSQLVHIAFPSMKQKVLATSGQPFTILGDLSIGEPVAFPSSNGRTAYGFYYPPKNKDFRAPKGELPPLVVRVHGGPTAQVTGAFSLGMQYWTSRGFAILDVNYGGSTGYGRPFRNSLNDNWGIVDVQDCESGANYLVKKQLADPKRLIITGGSAGGYTTLAALAFGKTFAAGASYYGVSDLIALVKETHRFESRYLDALVGPYPERIDLYRARSPVNFADQVQSPVIFFQGDEDKIVPLDQAEMMYDVLKKRGITTKLIVYQGEQHGFRKAANIKNALEEELAFYRTVFKIIPKLSE